MAHDERGRIVINSLLEQGRVAFDGLWVEDGTIVLLGIPSIPVSVFDSVAVLEDFAYNMSSTIQIFDLIAIVEDANFDIPLPVNVFDSISISESIVTHDLIIELFAFDAVAITEDSSMTVGQAIFVAENITIVESKWLGLDPTLLLVSDSLLITEIMSILDLMVEVGIVVDNAAITEYIEPSLDVLNFAGSDDVTIAEWSYQYLDVLNQLVSDLVVVVEDFTPELRIYIDVFDSISVAENLTLDVALVTEAIDNIAVTEDLQMYLYAPPIRRRCLKPYLKRRVTLYPKEGVCV